MFSEHMKCLVHTQVVSSSPPQNIPDLEKNKDNNIITIVEKVINLQVGKMDLYAGSPAFGGMCPALL